MDPAARPAAPRRYGQPEDTGQAVRTGLLGQAATTVWKRVLDAAGRRHGALVAPDGRDHDEREARARDRRAYRSPARGPRTAWSQGLLRGRLRMGAGSHHSG